MKKQENKKKLLTLVLLIFTGVLFAAGKKEFDSKSFFWQEENTDIQSIYNEMSDLIPAVVYFQPTYTTGVDFKYVRILDYELKNQMIKNHVFKPVLMNKWLDLTYGENKASTIYKLISDLKKERYSVNLFGICKSYIYKIDERYVIKVSINSFSKNGYPTSAVRIIKSEKEIKEAVKYMLLDISELIKTKSEEKVKLAVAPFSIECRTLIEQKTGEFDFIPTSFSEQEGVELKSNDDYFSELFAYQAQCTGLYDAVTIQNIDEYVGKSTVRSTSLSNSADYLIKGRLVLTNLYNVITIDVENTKTGKVIKTMTHITESLDLTEIWKFNYKFLSDISLELFDSSTVRNIEYINILGRCFYMNGMFAGFDTIQDIPIKMGKTVINTGTYLSSDISLNSELLYSKKNKDLFVFASKEELLIYKGRKGAYIWNLLEN